MRLYDIEVSDLHGRPTTLGEHRGQVLLAVNVASRCGYTPQYAALAALHRRYASEGFAVLGFPSNQFLQERGDAQSILACAAGYDADFPLYGKLRVNGRRRHPLYQLLTATPDQAGRAGRVRWNFEKFLIDRNGRVASRFSPKVTPGDESLLNAIEGIL